MVSIGGVMSLFGLTWLFAVFTFLSINELKKMFDSFFVIFNSFQGLFIFFSCIVLNKEIRESWKELLLCGRYQSKHLPHSQPRTTPKLPNTGSSGSTLPTGVKSTSEPSKSDLDTTMHKTAESESDVIKNPPPLESVSLDPDLEAIELDKLSIKTAMSIEATVIMEETNETAMSIKATVTMEETNETKESHETAMSTEATVTMEETNEAKEPHETAKSIEATVTMEETNETKESREEITVSDESKYEDEDMLSKMHTKRYTRQREFKYRIKQVEVDFYDDNSDKEESTKQI